MAIEKFVNQLPQIVMIDGAIVRFKTGAVHTSAMVRIPIAPVEGPPLD